MPTNKPDAAKTIRSLRGIFKRLRLMETHKKMKHEEKDLEEAKYQRLSRMMRQG